MAAPEAEAPWATADFPPLPAHVADSHPPVSAVERAWVSGHAPARLSVPACASRLSALALLSAAFAGLVSVRDVSVIAFSSRHFRPVFSDTTDIRRTTAATST